MVMYILIEVNVNKILKKDKKCLKYTLWFNTDYFHISNSHVHQYFKWPLSHSIETRRARFAWSHTLRCLLATAVRDHPLLACWDGSVCVSCLFRSSIFGQSGQRGDTEKEDSSHWLSSPVPSELFLLLWQAVNSRRKPSEITVPCPECNVLKIKRTE